MQSQQKIEGEQIAIAVYRPLSGKDLELLDIVKGHHSRLNAEGLVTARKPLILRATDGTLIEIFGWKSSKAIENAHQNTRVMKMGEVKKGEMS